MITFKKKVTNSQIITNLSTNNSTNSDNNEINKLTQSNINKLTKSNSFLEITNQNSNGAIRRKSNLSEVNNLLLYISFI